MQSNLEHSFAKAGCQGAGSKTQQLNPEEGVPAWPPEKAALPCSFGLQRRRAAVGALLPAVPRSCIRSDALRSMSWSCEG